MFDPDKYKENEYVARRLEFIIQYQGDFPNSDQENIILDLKTAAIGKYLNLLASTNILHKVDILNAATEALDPSTPEVEEILINLYGKKELVEYTEDERIEAINFYLKEFIRLKY